MYDIDNENNSFKIMNILQFKWILQNQIQKNNYNKIFKKIKIMNLKIIKIFIMN